MHGESISTPCTRHKGRQPLIDCAQCDFRIIYFSLFIFYFLFFGGRQGCCPCSYVSSGANLKTSNSVLSDSVMESASKDDACDAAYGDGQKGLNRFHKWGKWWCKLGIVQRRREDCKNELH